jgi:hypothetical protein
MADSPVVVNHERLADFIASVLEALTMSPKNARLTADLMVRTDLRGVDPRPRRSVTGGPAASPWHPSSRSSATRSPRASGSSP